MADAFLEKQARLSDFQIARLAIAILALVCMVGVLRIATTLNLQFLYDSYDEGWNAYHAAEAISGANPYPAPTSLAYNNYTPVSFYIVGAVGLLTHDNIYAGRTINLLSFLLTAFFLVGLARKLGATKLESSFSALLFMALLLFDYNYVGVNDPQQLGQAFGTMGLFLAVQPRRATWVLLVSAFLLSLGFFTKEVLVVQPLTAVVWLLVVDRNSAWKLAAFGAAIGIAGFLAFHQLFGQSLWSQINAPRAYSISDAWDGLVGWMEEGGVPVLASLMVCALFPKDRGLLFCLLYFALACAIGTYLAGGADTSGNVMFDAIIALSLFGGVGLNRLSTWSRASTAIAYGACHFLPVIGLILYHAATDSFYPRYWLERDNPKILTTARDIALIKAQQGRVMCQYQGLCYWAGKAPEADVEIMRQAILIGRRDGKDLAAAIGERRYAMIAADIPRLFSASPDIVAALNANYSLQYASSLGQYWMRR